MKRTNARIRELILIPAPIRLDVGTVSTLKKEAEGRGLTFSQYVRWILDRRKKLLE